MIQILEVGDIVKVKEFSYINKSGGSGKSSGLYDIKKKYKFPLAKVKIVKAWHDYETGWRFWAISANDKALDEYLAKEATRKKEDASWMPEGLADEMNQHNYLMFVGQFDVVWLT